MLTFTLAIFCLTTSNLPWFMDLTVQVPMQYCSLQNWILLLSITSHIHSWVLLLLWLHPFFLELFLHWSPVAYWAPIDLGVHLSVSYLLPSYCSWGSQCKNTEVVCHSLLQWTTFCQTFPPWPFHLGWPHMAWLSFTELDKAVVHVIRWLLVCDYLSVIVVSVCLPSHALSQCLPSYLCFSYLGHEVAPLSCSVLLHSSCTVPW